ncbi:MAG: GspH/FimT family pseudopilin [Xanthomonadaceae bacterium]|nr:GspH/FimT family pseudopilin [Xanthomonadaceae bacterium]
MQRMPDSICRQVSPGARKSFDAGKPSIRNMAGLTLPELMISLALLSLLAGLGLPSFNYLLRTQRASSAAYSLSTHFASARIAAITQRVPVTVCPSIGDLRCSNTSDWSRGWIVYRDPQRRDQPAMPQDILHEVNGPIHSSMRLISSTGRHRVRFQPSGLSGGSNLRVRICAGEALLREVIVNNSGRIRTAQQEQSGQGCDD